MSCSSMPTTEPSNLEIEDNFKPMVTQTVLTKLNEIKSKTKQKDMVAGKESEGRREDCQTLECEKNYKVLLTYIKLSKINLIIVKCHQFSQLVDQSDQPN